MNNIKLPDGVVIDFDVLQSIQKVSTRAAKAYLKECGCTNEYLDKVLYREKRTTLSSVKKVIEAHNSKGMTQAGIRHFLRSFRACSKWEQADILTDLERRGFIRKVWGRNRWRYFYV